MPRFNWKKFLLFFAGAPIVGAASQCLNTKVGGGHCAFTAGNVLLPGLTALVAALAGLLTKRPQDG